MAKFLDDTGLSSLWAKIKALIPTNNNQLTNGAGYITNEYMGYYDRYGDTKGVLYVPKDFIYLQGSSRDSYYMPFVVQGIGSEMIYSTTQFREIGSTTNIYQIGNIMFDGILPSKTSVLLNCQNLYMFRQDDGTCMINTVCNLTNLNSAISTKQDAPSTAGTAGQVLGLDSNLAPVWTTPSASAPPEVYVGSDTPYGYSLYIEPGTGGIPSGNEVEY